MTDDQMAARDARLKARAVYYACKAANTAKLAACYRAEAATFREAAIALGGDGDWFVDIDGAPPRGLPDDWMGIAELTESEAIQVLQGGTT